MRPGSNRCPNPATRADLVTPLHCLWLLALTAPGAGGWTRRALSTPPLRFIGEISYSIYCFDSPVIFLSAWTVVDKGVTYTALPLVAAPNGTLGYFVFPPWAIIPLLVVIVLVATAAHYGIERPSRELLNGRGCRLPSTQRASPEGIAGKGSAGAEPLITVSEDQTGAEKIDVASGSGGDHRINASG